MQQRGELHRWWGGARGTSVLLAAALIAACNGNIGSNGGWAAGRAAGRRAGVRTDGPAPPVAHRIRQHAGRSAG